MRWIRSMLPQDREALAALYRDCRREADWLPLAARAAADFDADTEGELVLVELEGDALAAQPVGFIGVWVAEGFVHHLYVRADRRSQGGGQRLLRALQGRVALPWQLKCVVRNLAARRFYARGGWVEIEWIDDDGITGEGTHALLELRELRAQHAD